MTTAPILTSTGHALSDTAWLDTHFESARPEYEDSLRWVGLEKGWAVLDAGCGGGGFLPLMSDLVGATGKITALDLAPENIARVDTLVREGRYPSNITTHVGSMFALPFADAQFDCVWSANVMQYVTDAEFARAVAEFKRVLKPGGLLAIKDFDATQLQILPLDSSAIPRLISLRRAKAKATGLLGSWCGPALPSLMRKAGLNSIRRRSWLVERWAPLSANTHSFAAGNFGLQARLAAEYGAPEADVRMWTDAAANPDRVLDDQDVCVREGFVVATGHT